jgi:hypothetical protein
MSTTPLIGEESIFDGVAYRCFDSRARSSVWISAHGELVRLYHDTDRYREECVRCDDDGLVRCGNGPRVEAAIAQAWLPETNGVGASLKDCSRPPSPSNIRYRGTRKTSAERGPKLAPCEHKALNAASNRETIEDVATECGVSIPTTWTYLCRAVSKTGTVASIAKLIHSDLMRTLRDTPNLTGGLNELKTRLSISTEDIPCFMEQLRLGRILADAERRID